MSLKCDVDSNPPSSAIWQKDDGDPPVSGMLQALESTCSNFSPIADTAKRRRTAELHSNTSGALGMVQMYGATPQQAVLELRLLPERSM